MNKVLNWRDQLIPAGGFIWVGIDPGISGGIAAVALGDGQLRGWAIPMPETETDIFDVVEELAGSCSSAVIEKVHAFPKQGVSSTFKFGANYGGLRMALTAAYYSWGLVSPVKWQRTMGCLSGGDKNITKAAAQRLFPRLRVTHAVADALLIAEYCRRESAENNRCISQAFDKNKPRRRRRRVVHV